MQKLNDSKGARRQLKSSICIMQTVSLGSVYIVSFSHCFSRGSIYFLFKVWFNLVVFDTS